jgi:phenylacetate-coenzyme A ligase PaaK-like adenylate-forming protein
MPYAEEIQEQKRWRLRPEFAQLTWFDDALQREFLPPPRQRAAMGRALAMMATFAAANVPYYRDAFARAGFGP